MFWKSWRHTSRDAALKQDSNTCAFCMIMLSPNRHALRPSFLSLKRWLFSHIPPFHLTWLPVIISCFPNSNSVCLETDMPRNALGSAGYQILMGLPIQNYERRSKNWIDRLKRCMLAGGEYFEGRKVLNTYYSVEKFDKKKKNIFGNAQFRSHR